MPRRPTHLSPEDGPAARFALDLRALRDEAGFDALTVDAIAARTKIPRSTLYAALRGQRIPTRPVLEAMVTAWGGDPVQWLKRRSSTEAEVEASRGGREVKATPRKTSLVSPVSPAPLPKDERETALSRFANDLRDLRLQAGQPSLREIARRSEHTLSHTTAAEVFRGRHLPQWSTLDGVIKALGQDPEPWRTRWVELRREIREV